MRNARWPAWTSEPAPCWPAPRRWRTSRSWGCTGRCAACGRWRKATMNEWGEDFDRRRLDCVHVGHAELRQGDRVRLRPRGRAAILDLALAGKDAAIEP